MGPALIGLGVFALSLALRVLSYPNAFREGQAQLVPFDDLYHAKRILFSASHFPRVLDFDEDRGLHGSFCPWPPLYDLAQAAQARLLSALGTREILRGALWFPPVFTSVFAGALAFLLARRSGSAAGLVAGLAVTLTPGLLIASHLGALDHHFLEPALLLILVAAAVSVGNARSAPSAVWYGVLFGLAVALALLVQTAMLFAAGLALVAVLLIHRREGAALESAALGFALAAAFVTLYRLGRAEGYPDGPWYLGWSHVAALLGAATACGVAAWWRRDERRGGSFPVGLALGLLVGCLAALSVPGAVSGFSEGIRFFGGDPWLREIQEFRPLFVAKGANPFWDLCFLGGSALLAVPFAVRSFRTGSPARRVLSVFAIGFLLAAVMSVRFSTPAVAVLAIPAALLVSDEARGRRFRSAASLAALTLLPTVVAFFSSLADIRSVLPPGYRPMIATANYLRSRGRGRGRVLGPWWAGHAFDVLGTQPVIVDNFGAAAGRHMFDEAVGLLLSPREETVARYCRDHGVRFLVVENPSAASQIARTLELPVSLYSRQVPAAAGGKALLAPTRLLEASFWWRAYFGAGPASESPAPASRFLHFRLVYPDPSRFGDRLPTESSGLQVWEFLPEAAAQDSGVRRPPA
jgi:Uncharacterized membrane protein, required for N-linked glycosylation